MSSNDPNNSKKKKQKKRKEKAKAQKRSTAALDGDAPAVGGAAEGMEVEEKRAPGTGGAANGNPAKMPATKTRKPVTFAATDDTLQFEDDGEAEEVEEEEDVPAQAPEDEEMPEEARVNDTEEEKKAERPRVWRPGVDQLGKDEQLDYDSTAYTTYHKLKVTWPCLSFDILKDNLGVFRKKFPHTLYMACGTQADEASKNKVMILKVSDIHRTKHDSLDPEEVESESDEEDLDDDPTVEEKFFKHNGGVNRLRAMPQTADFIATWADTGKVHIWDISRHVSALDKPPAQRLGMLNPAFTFHGHPTEGFAMAWSPTAAGRFLSGDCQKNIFLYEPDKGSWTVDKTPFTGHSKSVEDLAWSPTEKTVFASCSVDKTVRIWDTRDRKKSQLFVAAHHSDVNVISWNTKTQHLLASGSDDHSFKIWDLRNFKSNSPAAYFKYHKAPITSIQWHPTDESVLAVSSEDDSLTLWDMSLEADTEETPDDGAQLQEPVPPQLLFVHMGQKSIKELHFHPQIPSLIISTAEDGFNIFRPANLESDIDMSKANISAPAPAAAPAPATPATSSATPQDSASQPASQPAPPGGPTA